MLYKLKLTLIIFCLSGCAVKIGPVKNTEMGHTDELICAPCITSWGYCPTGALSKNQHRRWAFGFVVFR